MLTKGENEYLQEFIDVYFALGVEHLYIYDNNDQETDSVLKVIAEQPKKIKNKITHIVWDGQHEHMQHDAYNDCLKQFGHLCRWIGFFDTDELLALADDGDINSFLKDYEEYGALFVKWRMHNANGREKKEAGTQRERFPNYIPDHKLVGCGKLFVQPTRIKSMMTHMAILKYADVTVNEDKEAFVGSINRGEPKKIWLDHYFTRSYEEWCEKMERGSCDPEYRRLYPQFFEENPDLIHLFNDDMVDEQEYEEQ